MMYTNEMTKPAGRPPIPTICGHSDRDNYADGLCRSCAGADHTRKPVCHPGRKHFGKDLCKPCYITAWNKAHPLSNSAGGWRKNNPERSKALSRNLSLKRQGHTLETYSAAWDAQQGKCKNAACDFVAPKVVPDHRYGLQVDHDHATGRVRGLLCPGCNLALGCVQDDIPRLRGLISYLEALN